MIILALIFGCFHSFYLIFVFINIEPQAKKPDYLTSMPYMLYLILDNIFEQVKSVRYASCHFDIVGSSLLSSCKARLTLEAGESPF